MFSTIVILIFSIGLFVAWSLRNGDAPEQKTRREAQNRSIVCAHCHKAGGVTKGTVRKRVAKEAWTHVPQLSCSNCGVSWSV